MDIKTEHKEIIFMDKTSLESIVQNTLSQIRTMIDVDTIIGTPVTNGDTVIIPISKLSYGFVSGGSELTSQKKNEEAPPFAGGTGAGVNITPSGFLVISPSGARLLPVNDSTIYDRLIDIAPQLLDKIKELFPSQNSDTKNACFCANDNKTLDNQI